MADSPAPGDTERNNNLNAANVLLIQGSTYTAAAKYREAEKAFMEARRMYSRTGNDLNAANALLGLGDVYLAQSKHGEAKKAFTEAHKIHSRLGDDVGVANTLILLGAIYWGESKYDEANGALMEAYEIHSRLGSDVGVANALLGLGDVHRVQSRYREAERAFTEAHRLHSRIGYDLGAAIAFNGLGHVYKSQSKHGEAEKAFKEANKIYARIGNDLGAANALNGLGHVYKSQLNYGEAEKAFAEAHEIYSRIGHGQGDAVALERLGRIYVAQSQYGKAEKAFAEAHKICTHLGDDLGVANALEGLGQSYGHQLKHCEAEQAFVGAHEIFSRLGDDEGAADALTGLGQIERDFSKHGEAEKAFMEAHEIHTRVGNSEGVANALLGLGTIYRAQSRNAEAHKAFNDALKVPGINEELHSGNAYRNLGILAQNQYRYNEAEVYYRRALAAYDRAGHVDSKARTLLALGRLQHAQHKYPDAQEAVSEALAIWSSVANEEGCTAAIMFLTEIAKSQSKHVDPKDALDQLESVLARTDHGIAHAAILLQMGALCMDQAKYDEAEEHFRVAEAICSSMGNARCEAAALRGLGALYFSQGRDQEAERCFAQAHIAYPDEVDEGGVAKAIEEVIEARPLINKFFDKMDAQVLQLINLGKQKGAGMETCHIYTRKELEGTEDQHQDKVREVLNRIAHYRMDPASIKMMDTIPRAKGGQAIVLLGTLSLSGPLVETAPIIKEIETALGLTPEINEKWGFDLGRHLNKHNDKLLARYGALGLPPEALNKMFQEGKRAAKMLEKWDKTPNERRSELKVAVKVLGWIQDDPGESTKFFKSFAHEVSLMAKLSHPNIADLVGFVEDVKKGDAWIILAWEENGNVREFLQSGQWDIPERISLIKDTINGLEYLHTQQPPICHGDLKSLNILVNSSHRAVITDFGSARIRQSVASEREETPSNTSTEVVADSTTPARLTSPQVKFNPSTSNLTLTGPGFSLRWTAPEVLNDGLQDLPSDMWAMGWICWEIVTGKMPFQDLNHEGAIIMHTITGKLPAITQDTDLSHVLGLCSLMSTCWLSEPERRSNATTFRLKVRDIPSKTPSGNSSEGQKVRSAALLLELGKMHQFQSNNPARAEAHYQEALDIATRTKNEAVKANALFYLGEVLSLKSKYPEAEQASAEAHQIYSRIGNNLGAANALYDLGKVYLNQKKHLEAEQAFTEAHETFSRISRRRALADVSSSDSELGAADTLYHLGHLYRKQNKYREAEDTFGKAREGYSRLGHEPGVGNALGGLGEVYCDQAKHYEAERVFTESREIFSRTGNDIETARAQWRLGRVYESQLRIPEAENAFKDAHKLSSAGGDNIIAGHASRSLGYLYNRVRRDLEAEEAFHHALTAYDRTNDPDSRALTLVGLGTLQYQQRRYSEAEEALSEALTIWRSIEKQTEQILPLLILSKIFKLQSRHDEERDALIQLGNELARRNDGDARRADILTRLGDYYLSEGMYRESEKCYRLAQAVSLSLGDTGQEANALFGLGGSCACQRRYDEAEECLAGSRAAFATMARQEEEARALECLVEVNVLQDKFEEARVACAEARDLCKTLGRPMRDICLKTRKPPRDLEEMDAAIQSNASAARNAQDSLRAGVLTRFGYDHLRRGAFNDGEECFRLAQGISPGPEMAHERGVALLGLGTLFLVQKRIEEAEACFVQARVEFASIADGIQEATALDGLTMLYNDAGRIGDARTSCTDARHIYLRMGHPMSKLCEDSWERLQGSGE